MKRKFYQAITLILAMVLYVQSTQKIDAQESLSADTPFIEVNGKIIRFGSAIIAFSKIRQNNMSFDEKTIFSQIVQQLVNEELLSKNIKMDSTLSISYRSIQYSVCHK